MEHSSRQVTDVSGSTSLQVNGHVGSNEIGFHRRHFPSRLMSGPVKDLLRDSARQSFTALPDMPNFGIAHCVPVLRSMEARYVPHSRLTTPFRLSKLRRRCLP